jgi:hypothetical protein
LVEPAFPGEVRHHGRQERIAIVSARLRHDAEAIADRARRRIQAVGRCDPPERLGCPTFRGLAGAPRFQIEAALARRISRAKSGAAACAQTLKSLGVEEIYIDALITLAGPFQTADRFSASLEGTGIDLDRFVPVKTPCSRARTAAPSIGPSSPPNLQTERHRSACLSQSRPHQEDRRQASQQRDRSAPARGLSPSSPQSRSLRTTPKQ